MGLNPGLYLGLYPSLRLGIYFGFPYSTDRNTKPSLKELLSVKYCASNRHMSLAPKISSQVKTCESNEKRGHKKEYFKLRIEGHSQSQCRKIIFLSLNLK